ncbi:MAG: Asp-tRNA(Asn)/Glu-tRNA(Gln) amidotransferase GatCAB subunit B [Coxiellaceae bacterium]|nr:Asp-tRNA(Asn)/Glu-tRNA(Gln) amidotransferase GatCAB subunit B [Coxiellaceae bacterium]
MSWETVIGLEVHAQLRTESKLFSSSATSFGAEPNHHASIIDLGLPGTLPVVNQKAIELAVRFGLSINAQITRQSVFERKNYFYPDLPKGYQISQLEYPIVEGGYVDIAVNDNTKRIRINRAHLEEDAGKSIHDGWSGETGLDFNRAGTPLLEIVTEPDFRSANEAVTYLKSLHQLVRYLGVCDGNMQEGSFRCDVNLSIRRHGDDTLGTRTEIKNLNSFRFIEQAILFERDRQIDTLERGQRIVQETRLYDPQKNLTRTMRSKEEANDYRYFPDPDLLPVVVEEATIDQIRKALPELPAAKYQRYTESLKLSSHHAHQLIQHLETSTYFELTLAAMTEPHPTLVANWINGELTAMCYRENHRVSTCPIQPQRLAELLQAIQNGIISNTIAREVQQHLWANPNDNATQFIKAQGLAQINDNTELATLIDEIIAEFPEQAHQFRAGKDKLLAFFVGQAMKRTQGKANPATVNSLLQERLR